MKQETRTYDILGPKLIFETGNPQMGMSGRDSCKMMSTTDSGIKFVQSHTESGTTKFGTEGQLQVEVGASDLVNNDQTTFQFITHKGDFAVNADSGHIKVHGRAICIEATEQLVLQAPKIQIGYEQEHKTKDIKILAHLLIQYLQDQDTQYLRMLLSGENWMLMNLMFMEKFYFMKMQYSRKM
jgi:hypothetical protein